MREHAAAPTLDVIDARMRDLEALFLVPMETEDETLAVLQEYMELDNERDRLLVELE